MSEALNATKLAFRSIATEGLVAAYGEQKGKAIGFLLFGGYGVPGLIDDTQLIVDAIGTDDPGKVAKQFTKDAAAALVQDVAKLVLQEGLKKAGIAVTTFAEVSASFFTVLIQPVELGDGELPADLRKALKNQVGIKPRLGGLPQSPIPPSPQPPRPNPGTPSPAPSPAPKPKPNPAPPSPTPDPPEIPDRPSPRPRPPAPPTPPPSPNPPSPTPPADNPKPKPNPVPKPETPPDPPPQPPIPIPKAADPEAGFIDIRPELNVRKDREQGR